MRLYACCESPSLREPALDPGTACTVECPCSESILVSISNLVKQPFYNHLEMLTPRQLLAALLLAVCLCTSCCRKPADREGDVIILTDDNFDKETASGVWMLDIYAPRCIYCQQLDPIWRMFATEMKKHDVKVAKIDGTKNRVLLRRFAVQGFPSLYLLRNGQTWQYNSATGLQDMKEFALEGYKQEEPLPFHKAPNSIVGRVVGRFHGLPALAKRGYDFLKEEKGFSDTAIISGVLLIPLAIGAIFICVLDVVYTRQPQFAHQHFE